ncbi:MAG: AraC family transcriptional regulator [Caulobacterales bacterium GWE1_67_11]|nr:MAG: AraC family transcriptional regulator [Caulobacterales bacterium GWE1_67_11]
MSRIVIDNYHARMRRVLVFIDQNLEADLNVELLSDVSAFSRHHFQRQFSSLFGISVGRYVQLKRMKRASYRLAFRDGASVLEIALDSGFEGPEAFSRAFRRHFDQSPTEFRRAPRWTPWLAAQTPLTQARSQTMTPTTPTEAEVRILDFPETAVGLLTHSGDPAHIGDTIRRFIAWRKAAGLPPKISATFNIFHTEPEDDAAAPHRIDLCAATPRAILPNAAGVVAGVIPAGRCAVLRQVGGGDDLSASAAWLYGQWLPRSGHELRDFPLFAQRVSFFPDVPEHEAVTDIFLPIQS